MSTLSFSDRTKLERLFGMGGGYVLNFSNRTFREFVHETSAIDIFAEDLSQGSGSKASRLRAFWQGKPDRDVGKLILALCQYQKDFCFDGVSAELWSGCVEIGNRLCGKTVHAATKESPTKPAVAQSPRPEEEAVALKRAEANRLAVLLAMFEEMALSTDVQRRGYLLQELLNRVFTVSSIPMVRPFTRNGGAEQIDGAFKFDGWHYIMECRWRDQLANIRELDGLHGQVGRSGKQTMGIFLSINGWSRHVPALLKQNHEKGIFLVDGYDLRCVLTREVELHELLNRKLACLNIDAEPFLSMASGQAKRE